MFGLNTEHTCKFLIDPPLVELSIFTLAFFHWNERDECSIYHWNRHLNGRCQIQCLSIMELVSLKSACCIIAKPVYNLRWQNWSVYLRSSVHHFLTWLANEILLYFLKKNCPNRITMIKNIHYYLEYEFKLQVCIKKERHTSIIRKDETWPQIEFPHL